ncbi:hypothetical protein J7L68_00560 [bacterium]|nr:hypothetical protein [bacterium]
MKLTVNFFIVALLFSRLVFAETLSKNKEYSNGEDSSKFEFEYKVYPPFPDGIGFTKFAYNLANAIHINSREWTLRRLCPLTQNSDLDSTSTDFAERVLRSYPFWSDAKISPNADSTIVTVEIHDLWTTKIIAEIHYVADELEWSSGLEEENFAGLGTYISAGYTHRVDNDWWQLGAKLYGLPSRNWNFGGNYNFQGGLWQAGANLQKHDVYIQNGNILFAGAYAESVIVPIYYSQNTADTVIRRRNNIYCEFIPQWRDNLYIGGGIGYLDKKINFPSDSMNNGLYNISENSRWLPVIAHLGFASFDYKNFENLNNFARIEDIPTGFMASVSSGWNFYDIDNAKSDKNLFLNIKFTDAKVHKFGYSAISEEFGAKYGNSDVYINIRHFAPVTENCLFRYGFAIDWTNRIRGTVDRYFVADGRTGFRGYPAYYEIQHGRAQYLKFSGELRFFPNIEFFTFRLGTGLFFDAGGVSQIFLLDDSDRIMTDFGISFQICSTRSTAGNVNRFDISYNPQRKTFGFTIDSGRAFSFYLPMGISSFLKE